MSAATVRKHEWDGKQPLNLGMWRSAWGCICSAVYYSGDHDGMPSQSDSMIVHRFTEGIKDELLTSGGEAL